MVRKKEISPLVTNLSIATKLLMKETQAEANSFDVFCSIKREKVIFQVSVVRMRKRYFTFSRNYLCPPFFSDNIDFIVVNL